MNKKFLSAILFGALMVASTGTFVSCKDYDDDIDNLQEQLDKLATKADMEAQIASLNAAISAAKTEAVAAATEAKAKADAAKVAADAAASSADKAVADAAKAKADAAQAIADVAKAKVEAIAAAEAKVAALKVELEGTMDSQFESIKKDLAKEIATLTQEIETLTGFTTSMLTAVQIQGTDVDLDLGYAKFGSALSIIDKEGKTTTPTSYEFGKGVTGGFTVNAHETFPIPAQFLFTVSPVNAAVSTDMLSIVNSKGESIDNFIDLSVAPYDGLLTSTSRSAVNNGLHQVTVSMKKDADKAEFREALVTETGTSIAFALTVTKDGRTVTSPYHIGATSEDASSNITAATKEAVAANSTIKSDLEKEANLRDYANAAATPTANNENCYPIENGKAFKVKLASTLSSTSYGTPSIMASYITVDYDNKALSTTDKSAIKNLDFTGVDVVSKTNEYNLTVSGAYAKGVVVPLRVHTIDFKGNYQESVVVWVKAGEPVAAKALAFTVTPKEFVARPTYYQYEGFSVVEIPADAVSYVLSFDVETGVPTEEVKIREEEDLFAGSKVTFYQKDKETQVTGAVNAANIAKAVFAKINAPLNLQKMREDKAYEGTLTFYDKDKTAVRVDKVEMTKVLPTAAPEAFKAKSMQIVDGIYSCYLYPNAWNAATGGSMSMVNVFTGLDAHYTFTFADSEVKDVATGEIGDIELKELAPTAYVLNIAKSFIDDKTEHASKVVYNYGDLSFYHADLDHVVEALSFKTVYRCYYSVSSWDWVKNTAAAKKEVVYNVDKADVFATSDVQGANTWDNTHFGLTLDKLIGTTEWKGLTYVAGSAKLISNDTKDEDYFTVSYDGSANGKFSFVHIANTSNPGKDVPSTLKMKFTDMYGHEREISLSMTVKKN